MQCWSTQILDLTQYSGSCHNVDRSHQIKMVVSALSLLIISLFYVKLIFQAWSLTLKAIILVVDGVLVRYLFREASWTCGTWKPWKAWAGQEELVECCRGGMRSCKQVKRCGFARRLLPFTEWHGFGAVVLCWMLWLASRHWKTEGYIFMTSYCCFHVSLVCSITAMGFPCLWSG